MASANSSCRIPRALRISQIRLLISPSLDGKEAFILNHYKENQGVNQGETTLTQGIGVYFKEIRSQLKVLADFCHGRDTGGGSD
jgi:hypothetical protein